MTGGYGVSDGSMDGYIPILGTQDAPTGMEIIRLSAEKNVGCVGDGLPHVPIEEVQRRYAGGRHGGRPYGVRAGARFTLISPLRGQLPPGEAFE